MTAAVGVLFYAFGDMARRFGKKAEKELFPTTGGRPFPTVLRHRNRVIDDVSKARYHSLLEDRVAGEAPSAALEAQDPVKADAFYARCGIWLRENTRDKEKYHVLLEENTTYGFRRNLYGIKWYGLALNAAVFLACVYLYAFPPQEGNVWRYGSVLVVAVLHAVYFLLAVTKNSVLDASDQYGRQLVLALETLPVKAEERGST